jgi:hypothetical protein
LGVILGQRQPTCGEHLYPTLHGSDHFPSLKAFIFAARLIRPFGKFEQVLIGYSITAAATKFKHSNIS